MNIEQVRAVFTLCKEFGIRSIKTPELEAVFDIQDTPVVLSDLINNGKIPTEEEFLFSAVEGFGPKEEEKPLIPTKAEE
jgi:hypothetical protein